MSGPLPPGLGTTDHYQALGVPPHASADEIRAAYRRLMREHHPDHRPGDTDAEETARRLNAAWQVLGDSARRAAYDRLRSPDGVVAHTRVAAPAPTTPAYSADHHRYRAAFHRATLRVGVAVFLTGLVLLALTLVA